MNSNIGPNSTLGGIIRQGRVIINQPKQIWPYLISQGSNDLFDLGVDTSNGDGWGNDDDEDGDAWESFEQGKNGQKWTTI